MIGSAMDVFESAPAAALLGVTFEAPGLLVSRYDTKITLLGPIRP